MNQNFKHPQKWRETIDPFSLNYHSFHLTEVLGYPHAGNDVFHVKGIHNNKEITAYIKVARHKDAAIKNEVKIMQQFTDPVVPQIIDFDFGKQQFIVTTEMPGMRLSVIVGENDNMESFEYMHKYGAAAARIHSLNINAQPVSDRRFFHIPSAELLEQLGLSHLNDYFSHTPTNITTVFCHGDFHYANILWNNHHISGILDFELSGYGNRDYDIAWSLILLPG